MKLAFVKQDVYQDLYVCGSNASAEDLLSSSIMRVGPIGLFTLYGADFYIVKEENTVECKAWEKVIPHYKKEWFRQLRTLPHALTDFPEAKLFQNKLNLSHANFSKSASEIDWSSYDIVISINFPIPRSIIEKYHQTLWCYMIGEANVYMNKIYHGYDVSLTQLTRGVVANGLGFVDFPYSFIGPSCIEEIICKYLERPSKKEGIYVEINSVRDLSSDQLSTYSLVLTRSGHSLRFHRQAIMDNLAELYDSKYFVKIGGRCIRGNSVIEAISSGTLVLMDPRDIFHSQLLPKECWVYSAEQAAHKISHIDSDDVLYERLLKEQRDRVQQFVIDTPMESLSNCLQIKRQKPMPLSRRPAYRRLISHTRRMLTGDL
jgi:hypothetical protein